MTKLADKQKELDKIKKQILDDKIAPELAAGATQLVFGVGSADAEVVFVGEAPGKNEDEQGLPFVGAAGRFLDEMLEAVGMKRAQVYITNIVKYRPPENRDPYPDEKAAFLPFLKKQLLVIEPKLIITLGRHSLETLIPSLKISQCHGQPKRIRVATGGPGVDALQGAGEQRTEDVHNGTSKEQPQPATKQRVTSGSRAAGSASSQAVTSWVILPLFHPAAALYNSSMRQTLIDDFMKIPSVLALLNARGSRAGKADSTGLAKI